MFGLMGGHNNGNIKKKRTKTSKNTEKLHRVPKNVLKTKNKTNIRVDKVEKGDIMKP